MSKSKPIVSILADLHLDEFQDFAEGSSGWNSRLLAQRDVLFQAFARQDVGSTLIIAGDIVNKRGRLTPQVASVVRQILEKASHRFGQVFVFPGNHDYPLKEGDPAIHSLTAFRGLWINVLVVSTPERFRQVGGGRTFLIPWQRDPEAFREAVQSFAKDSNPATDILVCHQGISGGRVGPAAHLMTTDLTLDDLQADKFRWVFLGDYHDTRSLDAALACRPLRNVSFVGSPYQLNRGEASDFWKGIFVLRETGDPERISLDAPLFREAVTGSMDALRATLEEAAAGSDFWDVVVDGGASLEQARRLAAEIAPKARVNFQAPAVRQEIRASRLEVSQGSTVAEVLKEYLAKGYDGSLDVPLVASVADDVLRGVDAGLMPYSGPVEFGRLHVENFLSWGEVEVDLANRGLVLIDGENRDLPGVLRSNGAGKSVLVEALYFALFGKTLRGRGPKGLPVEALPNRFTKATMLVELAITTGAHSILVQRTRTRTGSGSLSLCVDGANVSKGGSPEATEFQLRQLTGLDEEAFRASVLFGQAVESYFAASSQGDQQTILDQLAGVARFDPYVEKAQSLLLETQKLRQDASLTLERAKARCEQAERSLEGVRANWEKWDREAEARRASLQADLPGLRADAKAKHKALQALPKPVGDLDKYEKDKTRHAVLVDRLSHSSEVRLHEELAAVESARWKAVEHETYCKGQLAEAEAALLACLKALEGIKPRADLEASLLTSRQEAMQVFRDIVDVEARIRELGKGDSFLQEVQKGEGSPCPQCGKVLTPKQAKVREAALASSAQSGKESLQAHLELLQESRAKWDQEEVRILALLASRNSQEGNERIVAKRVGDVKVMLRDAEWALKTRKEEVAKALETLQTYRLAYAEAASLGGSLLKVREYEMAKGLHDQIQASIQAIEVELTAPKANPHQATLDSLEADLAALRASRIDAGRDLDAVDQLLPIYQFLPQCFKNLKVFVYDSLSGQIEASANEALQILTDGAFRVRFGSARGKATTKERLSLVVTNSSGSDLYDGDSGGEKRLVDVALLVALHGIVSSRIKFLKADEAISPCDAAASLRVLRLLRARAEAGSTILFTSHREELKDEFQHLWLAVKENHITRLEVLA